MKLVNFELNLKFRTSSPHQGVLEIDSLLQKSRLKSRLLDNFLKHIQ